MQRFGLYVDLGSCPPHLGHIFHWASAGKALAILCIDLCWLRTWIRNIGFAGRISVIRNTGPALTSISDPVLI